MYGTIVKSRHLKLTQNDKKIKFYSILIYYTNKRENKTRVCTFKTRENKKEKLKTYKKKIFFSFHHVI